MKMQIIVEGRTLLGVIRAYMASKKLTTGMCKQDLGKIVWRVNHDQNRIGYYLVVHDCAIHHIASNNNTINFPITI